jgi:hypothetical protein
VSITIFLIVFNFDVIDGAITSMNR